MSANRKKRINLNLTFPTPKKSCIIFMSPRSGSNLLCASLAKLGLGNPVEAFHANQKNLTKRFGWEIDFDDSSQYMRKIIEYQTVDSFFSTKMNRDQINFFLHVASRIVAEFDVVVTPKEAFEIFFPNAKFIFLRRKNKVDQAISFSKGMQTGVWQIPATGTNEFLKYVESPLYHRAHIESCLDKLLFSEVSWDKFIVENGLDVYEIYYEDLAADFVNSIENIIKYVNGKNINSIVQPLRKQANKKSDIWRKKFIASTPIVGSEEFKFFLDRGDFQSAFHLKIGNDIQEKEEKIWKLMPSVIFKPIRKIINSIIRKTKDIISN